MKAVEGRLVVAAFDGGAITSDAGALLMGATDRAIKMVDRLASRFVDVRSRAQVEHSVATLVGILDRPSMAFDRDQRFNGCCGWAPGGEEGEVIIGDAITGWRRTCTAAIKRQLRSRIPRVS